VGETLDHETKDSSHPRTTANFHPEYQRQKHENIALRIEKEENQNHPITP